MKEPVFFIIALAGIIYLAKIVATNFMRATDE